MNTMIIFIYTTLGKPYTELITEYEYGIENFLFLRLLIALSPGNDVFAYLFHKDSFYKYFYFVYIDICH